jgi:AbrB family looped-hinge helix DNA binding protein
MASNTTVTRKGQVTIPVAIRQALGIREGDQLAVEQQGEAVLLRRATSVAGRTSGALSRYRLAAGLSSEEEREAFAQAVADEVTGDDHA